MILLEGKLDYDRAIHDTANLYLFTGNSYVKRNGALVMGRGAAREVRDLYPGIDKQFGAGITHLSAYGMLTIPGQNLGIFQVKHNYSDKAELQLIRYSVECLKRYAYTFQRAIYMNYPGVGNGGLLATDVAPLLASLPDNVFLYKVD